MKITIITFVTLWLSMLAMSTYAKNTQPSVLRLQLSWQHQFQFAGYYAALDQGFYREAGLNIELLEGGPGTLCDGKMLAKIDFCNASGSVVKQRVEGQPIVVLASILQHSPIVLITKKKDGLFTPRDLVGKRVEMLLSGVPIPEIHAMLSNQGIELNEIKLYENTTNVSVLLGDSIDALYGFSTNEPFQLREKGVEYKIISPRHYGVDFYGDVLLTSERLLQVRPDQVEAFRKASLRGWRYAMNHQADIVDLIIAKYAPHHSRRRLMAEAKAIESLMLPNLVEIGHINAERWRHTADTLADLAIIKPDYSLDGFIYEPPKPPEETSNLTMVRVLIIVLSFLTVAMVALWGGYIRLSQEIIERRKVQKRLRRDKELSDKIAYTDDLSGMGNRRLFYERGNDAILLAEVDHTPLSMVLMDIDHFKQVNDNYGHLVGDQVICEVADIILRIIRSRDIQARIGGEEFAIILPETDLVGAVELAERIRHAVAELTLESGEGSFTITASFGVSAYSGVNDSIKQLMQSCDEALYQAKHQGRNQVVSV